MRGDSETAYATIDAGIILLISLAVFAVASAVERRFVPDVVPVAFAEAPQPLWTVELSFLLRSIEFIAGSVGILALLGLALMGLRKIAIDWRRIAVGRRTRL
jgi:hypothetical protein